MRKTEIDRCAAALGMAERALAARRRPPNRAVADPNVQRALDGRYVIHARHEHRGIPLFLMTSVVHVKGRKTTIFGDVERAQIENVNVVPSITAKEAVREAVAHLQGAPADARVCAETHTVFAPEKRPRFRMLACFE